MTAWQGQGTVWCAGEDTKHSRETFAAFPHHLGGWHEACSSSRQLLGGERSQDPGKDAAGSWQPHSHVWWEEEEAFNHQLWSVGLKSWDLWCL